MILRRITQHLKDQNWFAVWLDLFIVVLGVFIGIQVANWNDAQTERLDERQYLVRLHGEILELIEINQELTIYGQESIDQITIVVEQIVVSDEIINLNSSDCREVMGLHIFADQIYLPATIEELISTGRLSLILNDDVRTAIIAFAQSIDSYHTLVEDVRSDRIVLSRKYPTLITMSAERTNHHCDFEGMRDSPSFRNDLVDSFYRYGSYTRNVVIEQQDKRKNLHLLLDEELGIKHDEKTP